MESEHPSARWERQVQARLAGLRPWLVAFWALVGLIAAGALVLLLVPR